jgi:hypothetical protein
VRISLPWVVVVSMLAASCYRLGAYACVDDDNCVDGERRGTCEATDFCGYPDGSCPSGRRYDDLAGEGLAGRCVDPGATASTQGDSGASSDGTIPTCDDGDGDGFGEGEGCIGSDCDDDNPNASDDCVYIGPNGDDAGLGTREAPWLTFARAVSALEPGASLVVLSGTYELGVHGMLDASCADGTALSGTPEAPIFVRAEDERRAHLATGGVSKGIAIEGCSDWRIRGLRVSGADAPEPDSAVLVYLSESTRLELRRMLLHTANRYRAGEAVVYMPGSREILFEDAEVYSFAGSAFRTTSGPGHVLRRVYVHGRGVEDLPDCSAEAEATCSQFSDGADYGVVLGDHVIVENAVFEGTTVAINGGGVQESAVLGTAALGGQHGVVIGYDAAQRMPFSTGVRIENVVGVGASSRAVYLRTPGDVSLRNVTAIGCGAVGVDLTGGTVACPETECLLVGANLSAVGAPANGMQIVDVVGPVVSHSNVYGSANADYSPSDEPIDDDAGHWRRCTSIVDPRIGPGEDQCIAYVRRDSAMAGAGEDGQDIGANILYRYEDGVLGTELLWDAATGAFPCGAVVEGINGDPADSCIGVHTRLHVATPGCPLPVGGE